LLKPLLNLQFTCHIESVGSHLSAIHFLPDSMDEHGCFGNTICENLCQRAGM